MVYQHETGVRLRATLASFFLIGGLMSLAALRIVGRLGLEELTWSIALLPGIFGGFALSPDGGFGYSIGYHNCRCPPS